jgi:hypothetical protein
MLIKRVYIRLLNWLFQLYGKLGRKCLAMVKKDPTHPEVWFRIADWCIHKRQDILQTLTKLAGLI